jgi:putative ABC transport system ATP-binding protein
MRASTPEIPIVELRGVTKTYREGDTTRAVLVGVDARIRRGELCVLIGRSGSGKSTLLNLIGGIDVPTSGEIVVDGTDLARSSEGARTMFRRHHVGFVFQFFNLIPTLTVNENVELPLALNGVRREDARRRCSALLEELDVAACAARFPEEISGGEQQRVAIARALVHEPKLVLADEPTGNLDLETARHVLTLLQTTCRRRQTTLIMATHSREATELAERVLSIRNCKIEEDSA